MNTFYEPKLFIEKFNDELIALGSAAIGENGNYSDYDFAVSSSQWKQLAHLLMNKYNFRTNHDSSGSAELRKQFPMFNECNVKLKYRDVDFDFIVYQDDKIPLVDEAMRNYLNFVNMFTDRTYFRNKEFRIVAFQYFLKTAFGEMEDETSSNDLLSDLDAMFRGKNVIDHKNIAPVARPAKPIKTWSDLEDDGEDEDEFFFKP